MAHLIDKDALVAEIERRIESCAKQREDMLNVQCHTLADDASARMGELRCFQDFLDTLEVKEVDIEDVVHGTVDYPLIGYDFPNTYPNYKELKEYCDRKGIKDNDKVKLIINKDM